jgi:hypothetical protein
MTRGTIHIPIEHIGALRESLEANRQDLSHQPIGPNRPQRLTEIDALLQQLDVSGGGNERSVSGARDLLWRAAYDALCSAAEGIAADCNDLWRGRITLVDIRIALTRLEGRIDLLESLGSQPDAQ